MSTLIQTTHSTQTPAKPSTRPLWPAGVLTVAAALLVNLSALPILLAVFHLPRDFQLFQAPTIGTVTVLGALGAVVAFALVRRWARGPAARQARAYWLLIVVALLVSILPNLAIVTGVVDPALFPFANFTPLNAAALSIFHLLTALVCGALLTTLGTDRSA
jgi:hypothetical protein